MSGHRPWGEIRANRPRTAEAEAAIKEGTRTILRDNALAVLRQHQKMTQEQLAVALGVTQENVSRIERTEDPQLSTIQRYVKTFGGELVLQVRIGNETFDLLPAAAD